MTGKNENGSSSPTSEMAKPELTAPTEHEHKPSAKRRGLRVRGSYIWALLFAVAIGGWLLSGKVIVPGQSANATPPDAAAEAAARKPAAPKLFSVRYRTISASERERAIVLRGRTEANARINVSAETAGVVRELGAEKGSAVEKGQLLCRLDEGVREAAMLEAKAQFNQAEADLDASTKLSKRGFAADLKVQADTARRDAARAQVARVKLDLANTRILAPISGVIEHQPAKAGSYLNVGAPCSTLVSINPLHVSAAVSERDVAELTSGQPARVELVTGEAREGILRFISPSADAATRTFRIEVEIANADRKLRDGITADVIIPLANEMAHLVPPAILTLADNGELGVRLLDSENRVAFTKVAIVSDGLDGVWITGLPQQARVITVGQDFVRDGEKVSAVNEETMASTMATEKNAASATAPTATPQ